MCVINIHKFSIYVDSNINLGNYLRKKKKIEFK